ncbi:hypothetical protein VY88_26945 [Azospirillum thiophilum]|uniref:Uncharacterized protein n=1 Tax=Azospirillum thiophilum TaxID=528244 RepID=A0AAC8W519_9PROT|nr:hypothetical protein [Azospirillum thiophilum]ALG75149.1 hypothetical protein AL072_29850 [Azospirillum thiophilum]KJR62543.1 hypothetical protein VY88_26945 [Azospirillum thiophilum]
MLGCKDWPPDVVLDTPIPLLELAVKGTVKFVIDTSPFAKREPDDDDPPPDRAEAGEDIAAFLISKMKGKAPP